MKDTQPHDERDHEPVVEANTESGRGVEAMPSEAVTADDEPPPPFVQDALAAIDGAEELADPVEALVERAQELVQRAANDPGAPLEPDAIILLGELKQLSFAEFERIRSRLKALKCRVGVLDEQIAAQLGEEKVPRPSQADTLINLASSAELFHTADGTAYADIEVNGHRETWTIGSKVIRDWLAHLFFSSEETAPGAEVLRAVVGVLEARARFECPEQNVYIRTASADGRLYIDLCNADWQAVEIDVEGWRIVSTPPVRFRRAAGMLPLPEPERGGSLAELRQFLNFADEDSFVLCIAWLLAGTRSCGPYPILGLSGEQGSAKSTAARKLRSLIDPSTAPLRSLPREERDLFIAAHNAFAICFDNVSAVPEWISDALCRLACGGGFSTRMLYSDNDEVIFSGARPIIVNGIEDLATRPDLADRSLVLVLEPIPEQQRRAECELWSEFEKIRPKILGALYDTASAGLRALPDVHLKKLPRMADFAIWITACEGALWPAGTFERIYEENRGEAIDVVLEGNVVARGVLAFITKKEKWSGTAKDLLEELVEFDPSLQRDEEWPASPRGLAGLLRRCAPVLRIQGVTVQFGRSGRGRTRTITLSRAKPEDQPQSQDADGSELCGRLRTVGERPTVRPQSLVDQGVAADADDADGQKPPFADLRREGRKGHIDVGDSGRGCGRPSSPSAPSAGLADQGVPADGLNSRPSADAARPSAEDGQPALPEHLADLERQIDAVFDRARGGAGA